MKNAIFISYRREDTSHAAGRLHSELSRIFPKSKIFIDIDDLPPGVDFRKAIDDVVRGCDAVLVCIGSKWNGPRADGTGRRLTSPNDFVRLEVEAALEREIPVVPVLVDSTVMPSEAELPSSIRALAYRNASMLRHASFSSDVHRLSKGLSRILNAPAKDDAAQGAEARPGEKAQAPPAAEQTPAQPDRVNTPTAGSATKAKPVWRNATLVLAAAVAGFVIFGLVMWTWNYEKAQRELAEARHAVAERERAAQAQQAARESEQRIQEEKRAAARKKLAQELKAQQSSQDSLTAQHQDAMDAIRDLQADGTPALSNSQTNQSSKTSEKTVLAKLAVLGMQRFDALNGTGLRWVGNKSGGTLDDKRLSEIAALAKQLQRIDFLNLSGGTEITDLSSLKGLPVTGLDLGYLVKIEDLSPLKGMQLTYLDLTGAELVADLSALIGMPLIWLKIGTNRNIKDLSALRSMKELRELDLTLFGGVSDLAQLKGLRLTSLDLSYADNLSDLSPLRGMPLEKLNLSRTSGLKDLSALKGMPLKILDVTLAKDITDLSPLRGMGVQVQGASKTLLDTLR